MSTLFIITYDVTDAETYAKYNPGSLPVIGATIAKHGGEILAASNAAEFTEGESRNVVVVLRFPSADAAKAWHEDPEYVAVRGNRLDASTNITTILVDEMPKG